MAQAIIAASADSITTMTSREIAHLVGKEHKHVMRDIRTLKEQLGDMFVGSVQNWAHPQNGQEYQEFLLDKNTCLTLVLGYDPVARMKVIKRWQELEANATQPASQITTLSRLDILKLAMEAEEARIKAEAERDHAIATKAQIGHQREATAMATASVAVRQVESLKTKLDESQQWATIKRMEMAYHGQKFDWRLLKAASTDLGLKTKPVFDANYGTVNAYHADAWLEAYAIEIL